MRITATFLDEISHDIPHQNWGPREWDADFAHMQRMGIDTVVMIRCGHDRFITYPSPLLMDRKKAFRPPVDLVELFLKLAEKYGMTFFFGTYDSGEYWRTNDMRTEVDLNLALIEEAYRTYGHYKSFGGWYLSLELSRRTKGAIDSIARLGAHCKSVSQGLPVFISPWIDGKKAVMAASGQLVKEESVSLTVHEREWEEIFDGIQGHVDIVAFQDGHVDYGELQDYLEVNKALADRYGIRSWTNCESFDRDMPIKFLPIKYEKLRLKLEAAKKAGCEKAITFEFSHFMSPQSAYVQAHHLYRRYMDDLEAGDPLFKA